MTVQAWQQIFERVEREARGLDPAKALLAVISAPLFVLGFLAVLILQVAWMAVAFAWSGALVGWQQAGGLDAIRGKRKVDPYA
ncbi:MAG TPA: hypothetical protein VG276_28005 [Actinomycetes bacterium]|jgi:hypothetical protein|nr:hypothetical protein [Actinomycetes bacterium]